jgi:hypothetical protein
MHRFHRFHYFTSYWPTLYSFHYRVATKRCVKDCPVILGGLLAGILDAPRAPLSINYFAGLWRSEFGETKWRPPIVLECFDHGGCVSFYTPRIYLNPSLETNFLPLFLVGLRIVSDLLRITRVRVSVLGWHKRCSNFR